MSNTRKTRPIDYRATRMLQERKKQKLRIRLQQANNQQRAAHARKVSEEKLAEMQARLLSGDMSFTEVQAEIMEDVASRFKPNTAQRNEHIHDDDGTVEGCPGCFGG
jgi:hypothetical protein